MGEHDNFQERLRAMADQFSRSVERLSEMDLEELAQRYGVDVDRARMFADAAEHWLSDRLTGADPLFSPGPATGARPTPPPADPPPPVVSAPDAGGQPGPHPLDLPTDPQGLALSALDSGRWTVRPGSNRLTGTEVGPQPPADAPDLVGELRARDWVASDGSLTLVGRHALARWCRTAPDPESPLP